MYERKKIDRAEEYYQQAITANPNHASNLGNYAEFLLLHRDLSSVAMPLTESLRAASASLTSPRQELNGASFSHHKKCPTWDIFC
jgi:Tfp pilus assembly protein PilF